jgi:AcrR family transcriptional regulator
MAVRSSSASSARRRRRAPEDARQEILGAARRLIAERPLHEVTVLAIMARTTLSRKSFYVYFRDKVVRSMIAMTVTSCSGLSAISRRAASRISWRASSGARRRRRAEPALELLTATVAV